MTQPVAVRHLSASGFAELSQAEMVEINGGGWFAVVKGFFVRALTWEVFLGVLLWDALMNPEDVWNSIVEGFNEFI